VKRVWLSSSRACCAVAFGSYASGEAVIEVIFVEEPTNILLVHHMF
jgi:predicted nucleotidyltransferase